MRRDGRRLLQCKWLMAVVVTGFAWRNLNAGLLQYFQSPSEGSLQTDVLVQNATDPIGSLQVLWGIRRSSMDDDDIELKRRDIIRRTYLGKDHASNIYGGLPMVKFCSLTELWQDQSVSAFKNCQSAYSFIVESEPTLPRYDPMKEDDLVAINLTVNTGSPTEGGNAIGLGMLLDWYTTAIEKVNSHGLSHIKFDWIIIVDSETLVYPPSFLNWVQAQSSSFLKDAQLALVVGETPLAKNSCRNLPRQNEKKACQKLTGSISLISSELARVLSSTSNLKPDCVNSNSGADSFSISQTAKKCNPNVQTVGLELPRQHRRNEPAKYSDMWNKLVEWHNWQHQNNLTVSYVTAKFGRNHRFAHQVAWKRTALLSQGWDSHTIHAYDEFPSYILDDPKWKLHLEFLSNTTKSPKGGGYWSWKAALLLHHMTEPTCHNGDFVVYADVDLRDHLRWTPHLLKEMVERGQSLAFYQVDYQDRFYDKRDVYAYYCPSKNQSEDTSLQYAGGWVVARKTPGVIQFLKDWDNGMSNYNFVNDEPSVLPNIAGFKYHLNDQSIVSLILKCWYSNKFPTVFNGADTLKDWQVHMFAF